VGVNDDDDDDDGDDDDDDDDDALMIVVICQRCGEYGTGWHGGGAEDVAIDTNEVMTSPRSQVMLFGRTIRGYFHDTQ
jgi:hypothetical protein